MFYASLMVATKEILKEDTQKKNESKKLIRKRKHKGRQGREEEQQDRKQ